ncbi:unnamed protein product [Spirodela intermedia]|uniref:Uncharacterized protein n=1 Tax=Spirodela intermedia TaxID=51605 RepID=A0A7I8IUT6_SPIIN|nr:unnamed protein product [Spirodela intermedia]CAA6661321.1 unnamed protein product [Spirodela intermedia]
MASSVLSLSLSLSLSLFLGSILFPSHSKMAFLEIGCSDTCSLGWFS